MEQRPCNRSRAPQPMGCCVRSRYGCGTASQPVPAFLVWIALAIALSLLAPASALVISAPSRQCGGLRRVVKHASAFFGPQAATSGIHSAPVFAPYPPPSVSSSHVARRADGAADVGNLRNADKSNQVLGARASARSAGASDVSQNGARENMRWESALAPSIRSLVLDAALVLVHTVVAIGDSAASLVLHWHRAHMRIITLGYSHQQQSHPSQPSGRARTHGGSSGSRDIGFEHGLLNTEDGRRRSAGGVGEAMPFVPWSQFGRAGERSARVSRLWARASSASASVAAVMPGREVDRVERNLLLADACDAIPEVANGAARGRVAVVSRGRCDFADKVLRMQRAGAVGVVVVNYRREGERLANMKLNESRVMALPIDIPAVMISFKDWAMFAGCRDGVPGTEGTNEDSDSDADGDGDVGELRISFTGEGEATFDIDYGRDALNWAMMRGMALWILCQCGVNVVRYKRRVSEQRARADAIAALPMETYSRATHHDAGEDGKAGPAVEEMRMAMSGTIRLPDAMPRGADGADGAAVQSSGGGGSGGNRSGSGSSGGGGGSTGASGVLDEESAELEENVALITEDGGSVAARRSAVSAVSMDGDDDGPVCAVCLDEFEEGQRVRRLECSHLYHVDCIDPWLLQSSNCCPVCKREVPNLPPPPAMLHYGSMSV